MWTLSVNKCKVGLKVVLVGVGLGYAQKSAIATSPFPLELAQFPSQDNIGQPSESGTVGGGTRVNPPSVPNGGLGGIHNGGQFNPPDQSGIGEPGEGTIGAGSQLYLPFPGGGMAPTPSSIQRGYCINKESVRLLRGLVPLVGDQAIADTVSSEISLWFYIPENQAVRAEFSILSEGNDFSVLSNGGDKTEFLEHYEEIYDISSRQGFVQITLPKNALEFGKQYWWDLTLVCDERDRSGDAYLEGSVRRQAPSQLVLNTEETALAALQNALLREDSALTLSDRQALGASLSDGGQPQTIAWIEDRLKAHHQVLWQRYDQLGTEIDGILAASDNPDKNALFRLSEERRQIAFELAQISPFFGLWGDSVDLLASYRTDYPEAWQQLLETIFQDDQFWLEESVD